MDASSVADTIVSVTLPILTGGVLILIGVSAAGKERWRSARETLDKILGGVQMIRDTINEMKGRGAGGPYQPSPSQRLPDGSLPFGDT